MQTLQEELESLELGKDQIDCDFKAAEQRELLSTIKTPCMSLAIIFRRKFLFICVIDLCIDLANAIQEELERKKSLEMSEVILFKKKCSAITSFIINYTMQESLQDLIVTLNNADGAMKIEISTAKHSVANSEAEVN